MAELEKAFKKVCETFNYKQLNNHQREAIESLVIKKRDVFVSLPTGFGKSVIYQALPIVYDEHTAKKGHVVIIISPLLSETL